MPSIGETISIGRPPAAWLLEPRARDLQVVLRAADAEVGGPQCLLGRFQCGLGRFELVARDGAGLGQFLLPAQRAIARVSSAAAARSRSARAWPTAARAGLHGRGQLRLGPRIEQRRLRRA